MTARKVLIVEDEKAHRDVMRKWLEAEGYECVEAGDGEEALKCFEEHNGSIGLVVLDIMMPKMNGIELMHYIRENAISTAPVIICTGVYDRERLLSLDVFACFEKPLDRSSFAEKVNKAFYFGKNKTSIIRKVKQLTDAITSVASIAI